MSSVLSQDATLSNLHIPPCMSPLLLLSPLTKLYPLLLFSPPTKLQHRWLPKYFVGRPPFSCQQTITWKLQLNTSMWIMAHHLLKGHVNNPELQYQIFQPYKHVEVSKGSRSLIIMLLPIKIHVGEFVFV